MQFTYAKYFYILIISLSDIFKFIKSIPQKTNMQFTYKKYFYILISDFFKKISKIWRYILSILLFRSQPTS
jgi:hypothetical protein